MNNLRRLCVLGLPALLVGLLLQPAMGNTLAGLTLPPGSPGTTTVINIPTTTFGALGKADLSTGIPQDESPLFQPLIVTGTDVAPFVASDTMPVDWTVTNTGTRTINAVTITLLPLPSGLGIGDATASLTGPFTGPLVLSSGTKLKFGTAALLGPGGSTTLSFSVLTVNDAIPPATFPTEGYSLLLNTNFVPEPSGVLLIGVGGLGLLGMITFRRRRRR